MNSFFSNLKNGILLLTLISIIGISSIITYISYQSQLKIYEQETLARLKAISGTLASQIDGDDIAYLHATYPEKDDIKSSTQDSVYKAIHEKLKMSAEMNGINSPIYTLMYHPGDEHFHFGVTSSETPYWMHHFKKFPQNLLDNYMSHDVVRQYESENGMWLSAFCAISKSDHKTHAGVIQVDMNFHEFQQKAKNTLYSNILITLLIVGTIALLIFFSINSLLRQQQEIQESERELALYRKELIANVSHDLRTPLASIQGYVETLLMPELNLTNEDKEKYLNITLDSTQRLKGLVSELFELSRLESKDRKLKLESFSLPELVHDILNGVAMEAEKNHIDLKYGFSENIPNANADVGLIERVFQNLISNSIKFCPEGSWIQIEASHMNKNLHVSVSDNGIGIPEDEIDQLFDRIYKGKNKKSGTGLGLAIVRGILELHDSEYSVENNSHGGVTFHFTLNVS